jgi:uncharacterized protein
MVKFPSRFRRLDEILADLPVEDPLLLTELDGYLTGIAIFPEPIAPSEWLPPIWGGGYGEAAPFEDPLDSQLFADMVVARYDEVLRDVRRGKLQPIFDVDERTGAVLWEEWVAGLGMSMRLRADGWVVKGDDPATTALTYLRTLMDIVANDTALTSMEINTICDAAASAIPGAVVRLYASHRAYAGLLPEAVTPSAKVGRNAQCPCGSGRKYKRCCGAG